MTAILISVIIICISCAYSEDNLESIGTHDIVECVFSINPRSEITIRKRSGSCIFAVHKLQNIGIPEVIVKGFFGGTVEPCYTRSFIYPLRLYNNNNSVRAVVYAPACEDRSYPDVNYDRIKVLKQTFNLGVKSIPTGKLNISTLLSNFWPEGKDNVWQEIYNVIANIVTEEYNGTISATIKEVIGHIKNALVELNNMTEKNLESEFADKFKQLCVYMVENGNLFRYGREINCITKLYVSPLHSNFVTMQMYFYQIGFPYFETNRHIEQHIEFLSKKLFRDSNSYISEMILSPFLDKYPTDYAGSLYNVIMNARSYFAIHVLERFPVWENIYKTLNPESTLNKTFCPFSYSNLYGRASADLLQQAINIGKSALAVEDNGKALELQDIAVFVLVTEGKRETVYGVKLRFSYSIYQTMGTTKFVSKDIDKHWFDMKNKHISELKVYKTKYIKCLEFKLSDKENITIGNHCEENSENFIFQFDGHYIHSLYLANDYPETDKFFDNVAVSYLPKSL